MPLAAKATKPRHFESGIRRKNPVILRQEDPKISPSLSERETTLLSDFIHRTSFTGITIEWVFSAETVTFLFSPDLENTLIAMDNAPKSILLISDPELGQLNVQIATSYALLNLYPNLEVHLASSPSAAGKVAKISDHALQTCPANRSPIHFHALNSPSQSECFDTMPKDVIDNFATKISWRSMRSQPARSLTLACPWNGEQFVSAYNEVKRVIGEVKPDVLGVDPIFAPAVAASRDSGVKFHLLMPTTMKDACSGPDALWLPV